MIIGDWRTRRQAFMGELIRRYKINLEKGEFDDMQHFCRLVTGFSDQEIMEPADLLAALDEVICHNPDKNRPADCG